jgi:hypothetical protein
MMIRENVSEQGLVADLFHDGSGHPRKAIILLGGSEGGKAWSSLGTKKAVTGLTSLGYTLLSLGYFKCPGLPSTCEEIRLEYFEKAIAWLVKRPEALPDEIALLGMSKGGELSLLLASMNPKIRAVVALSPSSVVWQGVPGMGAQIAPKSSWTYQGKPLPYVPFGLSSWNIGTMIGTMLFKTLRKVHEKALIATPEVEAATIPVEKIQGAILLMSGKGDQMWPSTSMCEQIMSRLTTRGFAYPHQHIAYDASHNNYVLKKETQRAIHAFLKENYTPV